MSSEQGKGEVERLRDAIRRALDPAHARFSSVVGRILRDALNGEDDAPSDAEIKRLHGVIETAFAALTDRSIEAGIARARAGVVLQDEVRRIRGET